MANSQIYLPSPVDLEQIHNGTLSLTEPHPRTKFASNKLFNFEHVLHQLQSQYPDLTDPALKAQFLQELKQAQKTFNLQNNLIQLINQIMLEKSIEYVFKVLDKHGNLLTSEEQRLNIGFVIRGGFSQVKGKGTGFAMLLQPDEAEFEQSIF